MRALFFMAIPQLSKTEKEGGLPVRAPSTALTLRMEQDSFQNPTTQTLSQLRSPHVIFGDHTWKIR